MILRTAFSFPTDLSDNSFIRTFKRGDLKFLRFLSSKMRENFQRGGCVWVCVCVLQTSKHLNKFL